MKKSVSFIIVCLLTLASAAVAAPFAGGWLLEDKASSLSFTSRTNGAEAQTSFLTAFEGQISPDGLFELSLQLDSVQTGDALQDARLRFLLLETFRLPQARVTAQVEPADLSGLLPGGSKAVQLPITLELNGRSRVLTADLDVVMIADDIVSVAARTPITLNLPDFGLLPGLAKLERAAGVEIVPETDVSFEVLFKAKPAPKPSVDVAALRVCARQIETIAQSDQVYFTSGSSELETKSYPLLDAIVDTMRTCPELVLRIEGHTDNVGPAVLNKGLSIRRAAEVVTYLSVKGVDAARLSATGFGEARPIADNATRRGRWKNRRIEFVVPGT